MEKFALSCISFMIIMLVVSFVYAISVLVTILKG